MKKKLVASLLFSLIFTTQTTPSLAMTSPTKALPEKNEIQLKDGQEINDFATLSKLHLQKPTPNSTLIGAKYVEFKGGGPLQVDRSNNNVALVQPPTENLAGSYYVTKSSGYSSWGRLITAVTGTGIKLTISTSYKTAATISYSFGASGGAFTQTLGYQYNEEKSYTVSGEFTAPANESWTLAAYEQVYITPYSVWYDAWFGADEWQGDGYATRPVGYLFSQWKN